MIEIFLITAKFKHSAVKITDILGITIKITRWSQIKGIINRCRNSSINLASEIKNFAFQLKECFSEIKLIYKLWNFSLSRFSKSASSLRNYCLQWLWMLPLRLLRQELQSRSVVRGSPKQTDLQQRLIDLGLASEKEVADHIERAQHRETTRFGGSGRNQQQRGGQQQLLEVVAPGATAWEKWQTNSSNRAGAKRSQRLPLHSLLQVSSPLSINLSLFKFSFW